MILSIPQMHQQSSVLIIRTYPLCPMNLLMHMIKQAVVILWITSKCTALDERQVNNAPYLFFSLRPSLTVKSPNISIPQKLNGDSSLIPSLGKRILHLTHFDGRSNSCISVDTILSLTVWSYNILALKLDVEYSSPTLIYVFCHLLEWIQSNNTATCFQPVFSSMLQFHL